MSHDTVIQGAMVRGDWPLVFQEAKAWTDELEAPERSGQESDPRPYFALNVVHHIRGDIRAAWLTHAKALHAQEDIEKIRTWIQGLLDEHARNPFVQIVMGLFLSQSGHSERSTEYYQEAIKLDPKSALPHYFLALVYDLADRKEELAIKAYRDAIKLDPSHTVARTNLGVRYQEQGRLEMAIPQYREVLRMRPDDPLAHANLACALAEQGKLEPAISEYKQALQLNPNDAELHFALGGLYETKGRIEQAMAQYVEATRIDPGFAPAETAIGWILFHRGKPGDAMDAFNRALRSNPQDASAHFGVGRIHAERGKRQTAMEYYNKALKLETDPDKKTSMMNQLVRDGNVQG